MTQKELVIIYDSTDIADGLLKFLDNNPKYKIIQLLQIEKTYPENPIKLNKNTIQTTIFCLKDMPFDDFYKFLTFNEFLEYPEKFILISGYVYVNMMNFLVVKGFRSFLGIDFDKKLLEHAIDCSHKDCIYMDSYHGKKIIDALKEINKFQVVPETAIVAFAVKHNLNHRESNILALLQQEKSYDEISSILFVSIDTVRYYVKKIYKKFNVHNRNDLLSLIMMNDKL
jgi:DNA-binding CsgD family transcriptional regulator